jgi:hypothetical protein
MARFNLGSGLQASPFNGVLSQTLNESTVFVNKGYATLTFYVTVPTGGAVTFEAAVNGVWEKVSMRSIDADVYRSVIEEDGFYIGSITGLARIRLKTTTAGSAAGSIVGKFSRQVSVLEGIEFGPPPHRFGYTPIHVDASYTDTQTDTIIWTADSDKKGVVTDIMIIAYGSTDGQVRIFDETDSTGHYLFKGTLEVATNKNAIISHAFVTPFIQSAVGNSIKITTSAAINIDLMGHGYQF